MLLGLTSVFSDIIDVFAISTRAEEVEEVVTRLHDDAERRQRRLERKAEIQAQEDYAMCIYQGFGDREPDMDYLEGLHAQGAAAEGRREKKTGDQREGGGGDAR